MSKKSISGAQKQLSLENDDLRARLDEAEETLRVIQGGDWDALVVSEGSGEQILTLKQSELRYRRLFEATQEGILLLNAETGAITDANPSLLNLLGYSRKELIKKKIWEVGAFDDIGACQTAFKALQDNKCSRYENLPLRTKEGRLRQVEFVNNIYQVDNETVIQCNIRDITERKQTEQALVMSEALLHEQSIRDHLTGLFNRRYMEATLERELLRASRKKTSIGIIMVDVDDFKRFNDTCGHAAGDVILRDLGELLLGLVRGEDVPSRYGGDEFIIILPDASREVTLKRAELLLANARDFHIQMDGQTLEKVTLSLGVAAFPENGSTSAALLKAVDEALYRAKDAGRNRVETDPVSEHAEGLTNLTPAQLRATSPANIPLR
jgi:diguanylate cyclase (GGDEF)-like protein/PAS domain S-box-containing protein